MTMKLSKSLFALSILSQFILSTVQAVSYDPSSSAKHYVLSMSEGDEKPLVQILEKLTLNQQPFKTIGKITFKDALSSQYFAENGIVIYADMGKTYKISTCVQYVFLDGMMATRKVLTPAQTCQKHNLNVDQESLNQKLLDKGYELSSYSTASGNETEISYDQNKILVFNND